MSDTPYCDEHGRMACVGYGRVVFGPITDAKSPGHEWPVMHLEAARDLERRLTALEAQHRERVAFLIDILRKDIEGAKNLSREIKPRSKSERAKYKHYAVEAKEILKVVTAIFGREPKQTT